MHLQSRFVFFNAAELQKFYVLCGLRNTATQVTSFLASLWAELGKKLGVSLKLGKLRGILGF
jgi:hypothetical protein